MGVLGRGMERVTLLLWRWDWGPADPGCLPACSHQGPLQVPQEGGLPEKAQVLSLSRDRPSLSGC